MGLKEKKGTWVSEATDTGDDLKVTLCSVKQKDLRFRSKAETLGPHQHRWVGRNTHSLAYPQHRPSAVSPWWCVYLYCALSSEKLWPSISWAELHSGYINDLMLISQYVHLAGKVCVFMKQLISTGLKGDVLVVVYLNCYRFSCFHRTVFELLRQLKDCGFWGNSSKNKGYVCSS